MKDNNHPFDCECEDCIEQIYPGEAKEDMPKLIKAMFTLEMEDEYYQHILTQIEKLGYHYLPIHKGIKLTKIEES